ncbi:MAG: hypothetical protein ACJ71N_00215 [Terriglobales bacterium]|jgi:hypothetical protein
MNRKLFTFALILAAIPAFAGKKEDLIKQAQAAAGNGNVQEAARLYCAAAQMDSSDKDAQQNCNIMAQEVARENRKNDDRFTDGVKAFNSGDFDTAEQKFKNIKTGSHLADAQGYLARIPQARAAAASASNESAMAAKFDQGVAAYQRNDFSSAKADFSGISGKHQADAQTYLQKIKNYEQAYAEGDRLADAKNYKGAASAYSEAASVKPDGPNDPRGRISQMNQLAQSSSTPGVVAKNNPPLVTNNNPPPVSRPVSAAVVESRPKVDVNATLRDAEGARKKGDLSKAIGLYQKVLSADSGNAQARNGIADMKKEAEASNKTIVAGSEADFMLAKGINEFYRQDFESAETHIRDYLDGAGSKAGLANFYLGASKLTRYILGGQQQNDHKLLVQAEDNFRNAKKVSGFTPPEKFVSPKIVKKFQETS